MANAKVVKKNNAGTIAQNQRARHDYFIEEKFEAGLSLQGWEVKSLRAGRMSLVESYITFKNNEAFLFGAQIQPLLSASTNVVAEGYTTNAKQRKTVTGNVIKHVCFISNFALKTHKFKRFFSLKLKLILASISHL